MSVAEHYDVLIAGAGHGGTQLALTLRQRKFGGSVGLVGGEPDLPYERPPLSKEYLAAERSFERLIFRPQSYWRDRQIALRLGSPIATVDPVDHSVCLASGTRLRYGALVWACGGEPRRLTCSGSDLPGVHTLRTRLDADNLRSQLADARRIAIVGAGYIGLEAAATLRKLNKEVTIVEALDRVLARVAGETLSRFYETEHRAHGVELLLGSTVDCIEGDGSRVRGLRINGGRFVPADLVIVGIGIIPVTQPLVSAGAAVGNGVLVDDYGRTSLADVYALGDCALHANYHADGSLVRLESVQNATDMALTVAKAITGQSEPYRAVPWFWSNQYDLRLQTVGLSAGHDDAIVRGEPASRSFSVVYRRGGRVTALDCVNAPKDFMQGRALVRDRISAAPTDLANTGMPLAALTRVEETAVQQE
ncbi:MAG TPA: FAD-dependent oxidoreductase [Steroidobacteraceae bacterium]